MDCLSRDCASHQTAGVLVIMRHLAGVALAGRLHPDHVGAEIREGLGGKGAGNQLSSSRTRMPSRICCASEVSP